VLLLATLYRVFFRPCISVFTYLMVQIHSWEAKLFATRHEIPPISPNPKVHYHTHKRPPTVSILGQPNPVHIPTCHFLEIDRNIIHPSTPRSPQWSHSKRFPIKTLYTPSSHPYAPHNQHISLLDFITRKIWGFYTSYLFPHVFQEVKVPPIRPSFCLRVTFSF
jgi:hypothetical protein